VFLQLHPSCLFQPERCKKPKISVIRAIRWQKQVLAKLLKFFCKKFFSAQGRKRQRPVAEADVEPAWMFRQTGRPGTATGGSPWPDVA